MERGGALFQNLAVGKFDLRALAQSMARELQPRNAWSFETDLRPYVEKF